MGRTLKRVAIDFKWPLHQVWKGYLNPYHSQECKACGGSGSNPETKKLSDDWYSFDNQEWVYVNKDRRFNNKAWSNHLTQEDVDALVKEGRLMDFTHTWKQGESWKPKDPPYVPTAEEVNHWNRTGMGHDSINQWICVKARAERIGVYGKCEFCQGEGVIWQSEEIKQLHEKWESFDPPKGEGYQLWETTSEGSPISPVFATIESLCIWAAENASTFGSFKATAEHWRSMLDEDFVRAEQGNAVFI